MKATAVVVSAVAAAGLAGATTPAVAAPSRAVVAGPIAVHGYQLSVMGFSGRPVVTVLLERDRGTTTQAHIYTVSRHHIRLTTNRIRADLGALGSIDLHLGARAARALPPGCHGREARVGTWTGRLRLVPDTTFFGTITATRLPGSVLKDAEFECSEPGTSTSGAGETGPQLVTTERGPNVAADTRSTTITTTGRRGPATVVHLLTERSTLQVAPDLSSASLTPIGSAITGSATFAGSVAAATTADGPAGATSKGTLSSTLTVHFDSIGDVRVAPKIGALRTELPGRSV
jgi:hypothetical protein